MKESFGISFSHEYREHRTPMISMPSGMSFRASCIPLSSLYHYGLFVSFPITIVLPSLVPFNEIPLICPILFMSAPTLLILSWGLISILFSCSLLAPSHSKIGLTCPPVNSKPIALIALQPSKHLQTIAVSLISPFFQVIALNSLGIGYLASYSQTGFPNSISLVFATH